MNLRCLAYRILDASRRTALMRWAAYHGGRIVIRPNVRATGTVISTATHESDGDATFHLEIDHPDERGAFRHCECTPCDPDEVKATVAKLLAGDRVAIYGDERFDPHHVFDGGGPEGTQPGTQGWLEFHGIHELTVLTPKEAA